MGEDGAHGCGLGGKEEIIGLFIPANQNSLLSLLCFSRRKLQSLETQIRVLWGETELRECGVKRGEGCDWNCQSWHRQPALGASPQLGVNNDSVQVRLYCFWPKAFCRNNFVTCCQGSFCPQRRQKNKEQSGNVCI